MINSTAHQFMMDIAENITYWSEQRIYHYKEFLHYTKMLQKEEDFLNKTAADAGLGHLPLQPEMRINESAEHTFAPIVYPKWL